MRVLVVSGNNGTYPDPVYPLGAAYAATACERAGFTVDAFDCLFHDDLYSDLRRKAADFRPDAIALSLRNVDDVSYPQSFSFLPAYRDLVAAIRDCSSVPLILGGSAATLFPQEYRDALGADCVITGDAEIGLPQVLSLIAGGARPPAVVQGDRVAFGPDTGGPDRKFFDVPTYYREGGALNIQTKRGCGFRCSFCTFPHLEGGTVRMRDPVSVVDELEVMVSSYGVSDFFIVDSVFNYPETHARGIAEEIIRRSLRIRWTCYMRPAMRDLGILDTMKAAGCTGVELGTESMAEPTLKSLNKRITTADISGFCERCRSIKLPFCHALLFGAPGETKDTLRTSLERVEATRPAAAIGIIGIRLYRNTLLTDQLTAQGYLSGPEQLGLEPHFYIATEVRDWIVDYLREYATAHPTWIIPGLINQDRQFVRYMRRQNRKGAAWEFKQFESFKPSLRVVSGSG